jgi:hypothetical protein
MSGKKENRSPRLNVVDRLLMNLSQVFLKQFNPSKEIRVFSFFARMLECVTWHNAEYAETAANRRGHKNM